MSRLSLVLCSAAAGSALLVLYVLSTGPFCWLIAKEYLSDSQGDLAVNTIYAPINWCAKNSKTIEMVLTAWVDWWSGTP